MSKISRGLPFDRALFHWLLVGCILIILMVLLGGITRLTGSGLSITQWKIVTGTFPPMNPLEWQHEFDLYRQTSQFQLLNYDFSLADFKSIYWWEYLHRLLGRFIGLAFVVPFLFFLFAGRITAAMMPRLILIFFLGGLQGFLGWYMVKSGLVDRISVSHFRLALHLVTALVTFAVVLWVALEIRNEHKQNVYQPGISLWVPIAVLGVLLLQIIYGAFVAGLKAGYLFNTFPLMGDTFVPPGLGSMTPLLSDLTHNLSTVQFIHRMLGWVLLLGITMVWITYRKKVLADNVKPGFLYLLGAVWLQFVLGVLTIFHFTDSPVWWGTIHQMGAVVLISAAVHFLFTVTHPQKKTAPLGGGFSSFN